MERGFQAAASVGVTVCRASGDDGSTDRVDDGRAHVDYPASSPYVLGCGGTRLIADGAIDSETVWNEDGGATGGGVSDLFDRPDGQRLVLGGTSAVAPLWAGLLALANEQLAEPVSFLNPRLYERLINEATAVGPTQSPA